jgi:hypothetical protein
MNMDTDNSNFRWPDTPPYPAASWFKITGAELGLDEAKIRFAAAMIVLGGAGNKNNSAAAKLAGMDLNRTEAFRLARSVKVRKLVDAAEEIKTGKRRPLTEAEIDARIDKMCMSPIDRDAAIGIKLRDDRKSERLRAEADETSLPEQFASLIATLPQSGVGAALAMGTYFNKVGDIFNFPFLELCAPIVRQNFATEWQRFRNGGVKRQDMADYLDKCAAGVVIDGDDLVSAVRAAAASSTRHKPVKDSADGA